MANLHCTGPGPGPGMMGLFYVCTLHTTLRPGMEQGTGTNGSHAHFPVPIPVPGPVQCEQAISDTKTICASRRIESQSLSLSRQASQRLHH